MAAPEPGAARSPVLPLLAVSDGLKWGLRVRRNQFGFTVGAFTGSRSEKDAGPACVELQVLASLWRRPPEGALETPAYTRGRPLVFGDCFFLLLTSPYPISITVLEITGLCRNH